jgi:hypothetical protein
MAENNGNTGGGTAQHKVATAILLEAVERIAGKEHSRDDITEPGSYDFDVTISGHAGVRELSMAFAGTLQVDADGVKTPSTPYQQIAGYLLGKLNDATRQVCLTAIASGEFAADDSTKSLFESACKQWRERTAAANPERKRGNVKPTYHSVDVTATAATAAAESAPATPTTRKQRKAG